MELVETIVNERCRAFVADNGDAGRRLDRVLLRHLAGWPGLSRTRLQRWIAVGRVELGGEQATRASVRVAGGERLLVRMGRGRRRPLAAERMPLSVLYEDAHLLAIDKPAGLAVHPGRGERGGTLVNALLWHARTWEGDRTPRPIHRLDRDTSGVVLVAKTAGAARALGGLIRAGLIEKTYLAVGYGRTSVGREGTIRSSVEPDPLDHRRMVAVAGAARLAVTRYRSVAASRGRSAGLLLLCCRPITGRTHQIRVHLRSAGYPIVGDPLYGGSGWQRIKDPSTAERACSFARQALHAWRLRFTHPVTGVALHVSAPVPADMAMLLDVAGLSSACPVDEEARPGRASLPQAARPPLVGEAATVAGRALPLVGRSCRR